MAALTPNLTRSAMTRTLPAKLEGLNDAILALLARPVASGEELLALEQEAVTLGARVADSIVEARILEANGDKAWRKGATKEARARFQESGEIRRVDNQGHRPVSIRLAGGTVLPLMTPYLRPLRKGMVGRPRTKRGPDGSGCYPVLEKFGIQDGVTPLTRSKISRQIVQCGSYAEAQAQLRADGLDIDVSTMVRVAVATGTAALERRDEALARALEEPLPEQSLVEGMRIRVSIDGGRARTRSTHTKRRKKKNGRRSFDSTTPRCLPSTRSTSVRPTASSSSSRVCCDSSEPTRQPRSPSSPTGPTGSGTGWTGSCSALNSTRHESIRS